MAPPLCSLTVAGRDAPQQHQRRTPLRDHGAGADGASYFKPKYLPAYGTLQDGGLKHNNPSRPGLHEVRRTSGDDCDVVLSIGTGFEQKLLSPVASNVRNLLQDGALARLYRASMESLSLNGQTSWEDHWFGLDEEAKKRQFRLNLPLVGKEPRIDDVDMIPYLYEQIQYHLGDMEGIVRVFKAVSFFFQLAEPPVQEGVRYRCRGSILSRSPDSSDLLRRIRASYPYAQLFFNETSLGFLAPGDICRLCGRFQKAVSFHVRHPTDRVDVYLGFNRLFRRSISAFPQCMRWFEDRQKLSAKFGQPDHRSRLEGSLTEPCCGTAEGLDGSPAPVTKGKKRSLAVRMSSRKRRRT
jgi:hypothetical protein